MKRFLRSAFAFALTAAVVFTPAQAIKATAGASAASSGGVVLLSDDDHCHGC